MVAIRAYYERNTALFLTLGAGRTTRTIHRALWGPGVVNHYQALAYSATLISEQFAHITPPLHRPWHVVDLGCGVGGTLFQVIRHRADPPLALGLTLSGYQARAARRWALDHGMQAFGGFAEADFHHTPVAPTIDLAWAIEAFCHALDPQQVYQQVATMLRPGGRLVVIDDMLTDQGAHPTDPRLLALVDAFRVGWHVPGLRTQRSVVAAAAQAGLRLVEARPLTPYLQLVTLPTFLTQLIVRWARRVPLDWRFTQSNVGSLALQHCLDAGLVEYQMLVFERPAATYPTDH